MSNERCCQVRHSTECATGEKSFCGTVQYYASDNIANIVQVQVQGRAFPLQPAGDDTAQPMIGSRQRRQS